MDITCKLYSDNNADIEDGNMGEWEIHNINWNSL